MASAYFSTNTELGLINALTQSLTVYLPQNSVQGKSLFIKDAAGTSLFSTITVQTQGSDTFEDGSTKQFLNSAYESMQLVYNAPKWYITGGTMFNTMTISTLRTQAVSTNTISSLTASFSTLRFVDQLLTSTSGNLNTVSSFLYFNSNIVNGGIRTAIPQGLNQYSVGLFNPKQIPNLALWLDATDNSTFSFSSGSNVSQWNDKSSNGYNFTTVTGTPTLSLDSGNVGVFFSNARTDLMRSISATIPFTAGITNLFVIAKLLNPVNYAYIVDFGISQDFSLRFNGGSLLNYADVFYTQLMNINGTITNQNTLILNGISNINTYELYDGIVNRSGTSNLQLSSAFVARYMNGYINEVIMYNNSNFTNFQRQTVEGYLAWKYKINTKLPAPHPFRSFSP